MRSQSDWTSGELHFGTGFNQSQPQVGKKYQQAFQESHLRDLQPTIYIDYGKKRTTQIHIFLLTSLDQKNKPLKIELYYWLLLWHQSRFDFVILLTPLKNLQRSRDKGNI